MKRVYFIRHGQSLGNRSFILQQHAQTALSTYGMQQAAIVAEHIAKLPVQVLIASPFERASATAKEISKATGLSIEYSDLFVERRRPNVQHVKRKVHPAWLWAQLHLAFFSRREGFRYADEETPSDLLTRAHAALAYLANRPEETIVVVTHGRFMRALYACMTLGEGSTARAYLRLTRSMNIGNTALMVANYNTSTDDSLEKLKWSVLAWNADAKELQYKELENANIPL